MLISPGVISKRVPGAPATDPRHTSVSSVVRLRSRFVDDFVRGVLRVGAFRLEGWIEGSMGGPTLNWGTFDDAAHDRAAERRRLEARGDGGEAEAAFVENLARQGQRRRLRRRCVHTRRWSQEAPGRLLEFST